MENGIFDSILRDIDFSSFENDLNRQGFQNIKGKQEIERRTIFDSGFLIAIGNRIYGYSANDCSELYLPPKYYFRPKTIDQLQKIVRVANIHKIPLTFASGKTGLSAGYANFAAIVDLDFLNFNEPSIQMNLEKAEITAAQDVLISDLIKYVPRYSNNRFIFPIQPSSAFKLPVQVGGIIGSNASGVTSGKLGACDSWIQNMQIMTPKGEILHISQSGTPDIFDKIIGKNGYFGIVLKATFRLFEPESHLQNRIIFGSNVETAFNGLQIVQDRKIFPLTSEYVMSKNGLLGKFSELSTTTTTKKVKWAVLIRGSSTELHEFSAIMKESNHDDVQIKEISDSEFRDYLEERTNQALLAENATSDLAIVKFPGFEDILAPPSKLNEIINEVNRILKNYGFEQITIGYGHLNFRKGKGLLLHSRIPVPIEMLVHNREETLKLLAQIIVETNLLLRDKYGIRAKEEHSGGAFGIWFDPQFRETLDKAMQNDSAFHNPHLILYKKFKQIYPNLDESTLLQKLVYLYLQNS